MNKARMPALLASVVVAVLAAGGCQGQGPTRPDSANVEFDGQTFTVSGPYSHENVAVFLAHSGNQDQRDFLTLDEGLRNGRVKVTEKPEEQVSELMLENQSDRPLYLQEGERLEGGKQDRTIIASLVVAPHSDKVALPTACIEQNRWTKGDKGARFGFTTNAALAPKGVRGAAKVDASQERVWTCVAVQKDTAKARWKAANTNSSANEMLDSPQAQDISARFTKPLMKALEGQDDVVGVVIVVNGQIEEVNVYPNHGLLRKLYPRLIASYALQAAMLQKEGKDRVPPSVEDVARFIREGKDKSKREKKIDSHNHLLVHEMEDNKFKCQTRYDGKVVHWQILKKNGSGGTPVAAARRGLLGNDW
jgi:hypothetical protein